MKSFIVSTLILGLVGLAVGVAVEGATTTPVTATVTAQLISVSVSDGDVQYGILGTSVTKDTVSGPNQTQTATNNSNVTANLNILSSDAVGGASWDLAAVAGANAFTHGFSVNSGAVWTAFNVDNITYSSLATSTAPNGTKAFDLRIGTPTSSTDNVEKTITITVQASL